MKIEIKKEKYDYYYEYTGFPNTILLRKPIVTVCYILLNDGNIGRGISICSRQDTFSDIEGKKIAKYNAIRGLKCRLIPLIRRREAVDLLIKVKCPFIKKGELNPVLSWWEKKFLFGKKGMYEYRYKGGFTFIDPSLTLYSCRYDVQIDGKDYKCIEKSTGKPKIQE